VVLFVDNRLNKTKYEHPAATITESPPHESKRLTIRFLLIQQLQLWIPYLRRSKRIDDEIALDESLGPELVNKFFLN
jgi:hypothetical protein